MIQAAIPILVSDGDDILLGPQGTDLIRHALSIATACKQIHRLTVVSNNDGMLEKIRAFDVEFQLLPDGGGGSSLALPEHYLPWPKNLQRVPTGPHMMVITPRNPLLRAITLDAAIQLFLGNPEIKAMASVVASRMHPCQLFFGRPVDKTSAALFLQDENALAEKKFFPDIPALWCRHEDGSATNLLTGCLIQGRQNFPETVEPDGSFLLIRAESPCIGSPNVNVELFGFKLPCGESMQIAEELDVLRYRALMRAATQDATTAP